MALYSIGNGMGGTQQVNTTTYKTQFALTAATGATTLRKGWIFDVTMGADGTPADNAVSYVLNRQTTVGTGTTVVPAPLDSGDAAGLLLGTVNYTIEPTITTVTQLLEVATNQRATYRWCAVPGAELVVPATNVAGIGGRSKSPAYTGTTLMSVQFRE